MNLKDFKSGEFKKQFQYQSFSPTFINQSWIWDDPKINTLLEQATRALGELNAFSLIVPDVNLFIRMHIIKEANTSSRIEGTSTTMDEAVLPRREQIAPEKQDDWEEGETNKGAYYDALMRVRQSNDLAHWIKSFLVAVIATAEKGKETFQKILALRNKAEAKLLTMGCRAKNGQRLLALLYREPMVNTRTVSKELKISQVSADKLVEAFVSAGILTEMTGFERNRIFRFKRYFDLFLK